MFLDRTDAGRLLAEVLARRLRERSRPLEAAGGLVLGLPRGGVPVAAQVAVVLGLPLDILVVRKIGVPWQPELALGAVGESLGSRGTGATDASGDTDGTGGAGGTDDAHTVVLNDGVVASSGLGRDELDALIVTASKEAMVIVAELRPGAGPLEVSGRLVIVVDDGVATGATARAAAGVLRHRGSGPIVLASPVVARSTLANLRSCYDEVVGLRTPSFFGSVGRHYHHFDQVTTEQVRTLLGGRPS